MKVSIITICFNSEKTIRHTIESVISQDYNDVEYILVDGNSKDKTLEIISSFGSKIQKLISEEDRGIYDAMNKGVQLATGEVIGILNSDDIYTESNVISKVVNTFSLKNTDSVYADLLYVSQTDTSKVRRKWISGKFKRSKFKWGWMPPHPTFFVKKNVYERIGLYNLELRTAADYEFMLRALYKEKISTSYLPHIIVKMRLGGESNSSFTTRIKANKEDKKAWKINNITPYIFTLWLKPLRKVFQFITR